VIACYDLARCPPTYDVVSWLVLAEVERLKRGEEYIDVRLMAGPNGGFRNNTLWPNSVEERQELLNKIVVPMCELLPSVKSVMPVEFKDRATLMGQFGYGHYLISLKNIVKGMQANCRPLRAVGVWDDPRQAKYLGYEEPDERKIVTITLRESDHHLRRNSKMKEWLRVAEWLEDRKYRVIIIRDTSKAKKPLDQLFETSEESAIYLHERALLYSVAVMNLGVSNGPMWMALSMNLPVLMMRPTTESLGACYNSAFFKMCGVPVGGQLPNSPPYQRLVWNDENDRAEDTIKAFDDLMDSL
jgi:hypothetical protein